MYEFGYGSRHLGLKDKFCQLSFSYIVLIVILACVGTMTLYSAANGSWEPWAIKHISRFGVSMLLMIGLAMVDIRYFYRGAYLFYFATLFLLVVVEITGHIGMGAQRWINLGLFKIQPSELMKIGMVLFLARYFSFTTMQNIRTIRGILIPVVLTIIPVGLICLQPDLGTALMLLFTATIKIIVVVVRWWKFSLV